MEKEKKKREEGREGETHRERDYSFSAESYHLGA